MGEPDEMAIPEAAEVQEPPEAIPYASVNQERVRPPIAAAVAGYVFALAIMLVGLALLVPGLVMLAMLDASGVLPAIVGLAFIAVSVWLVIHIALAQSGQGSVTREEAAAYGAPQLHEGGRGGSGDVQH